MQKIHCPECGKQFMWTDDQPIKGKCPNPGCNGQYDVREAIGKSLAREEAGSSPENNVCPACGSPIFSRWTCCKVCRTLILGLRPVGKLMLMLVGLLILVLLTVTYRCLS